jgi:hypothetical protein
MAKPNNQDHQLLLETYSKFSLHYLTGHNLEWYFRIIARPFFYLVALNIAFYLVGGLPTLEQAYDNVFLPLIFIIELVTYAWVGWKVAYVASWKTLPHRMRIYAAGMAGGITGISLGITLSLFKVFWFRQLWTIFNIVTEPSFRLIEGLLVALAAGLVTLLIVGYRQRHGYI